MDGKKQHWVDTPVGVVALVGIGVLVHNWFVSSKENVGAPSLSAESVTTQPQLPSKCRPAYESVLLLMMEQNCQEWAIVTAAGHKAQVRIGKLKETLGCIPTVTDKIKDEMQHVAEGADRLKVPPMELWCTGAMGMFNDTSEHESWFKVLK